MLLPNYLEVPLLKGKRTKCGRPLPMLLWPSNSKLWVVQKHHCCNE